MKKHYLFGLIAAILVLALAFTGCSIFNGGDDDDKSSKEDLHDYLTVTGYDHGDTAIKTIFSTKKKVDEGAVVTPSSDDSYRILQGNNEVSSGTIRINQPIVTFSPSTGIQFLGVLVNSGSSSILTFPDGITTSSKKIELKPNGAPLVFTTDLDQKEASYNAGDKVTALTVASSSTDIMYQWYKSDVSNEYKGKIISNAAAASYTPSETGYYYVCIMNSGGAYARSLIAMVTIKGTNSGGDITDSLGAGGDVIETTNNSDGTKTITIKGDVKATSNFDIPTGTTLKISNTGNTGNTGSTGSTIGKLTVPAGRTITVSGTLDVGSGSTLKVDGKVVVAKGGKLSVNADKSANNTTGNNSNSQDGKLDVSGTITVESEGQMYIPDISKYDLSAVTGTIEIEAKGELFKVISESGNSSTSSKVNYPWIGTSTSQNGTGTNANYTGADFDLTDGNITLNPYKNTSSSSSSQPSNPEYLPYISLYGDATVLGPKKASNSTARETVNINSQFLIASGKTLTIGDGSVASTLDIVSSGTIARHGADIIVKEKSTITAYSSTAIIGGNVVYSDKTPITPTADNTTSPTKWTWSGTKPASTAK